MKRGGKAFFPPDFGKGVPKGCCALARVGFTTSIPIEVLVAAGCVPVDLNNRFIQHPRAPELVREAERKGFPATCCAWMKGIYSIVGSTGVDEVVAVVRGDCSQTQALMESLQLDGISVYPFAYPYDRSRQSLEREIEKLMCHYRVGWAQVAAAKQRLDRIRRKLREVDLLTWREGRVTGEENHRFLVAASDMDGDPDRFEEEVDSFLKEAARREPRPNGVRIGYLGVPAIWTGLYAWLERNGAWVVYNEMQRQFSMPGFEQDLVTQYLDFTYPYDIFFRLEEIRRESTRRRIDGFVHYVQSFCFRQMEDRILRKCLDRPILTLEGDLPGKPDGRTVNRIEAFLEVLSRRSDGSYES